jgi:hypothetical protein
MASAVRQLAATAGLPFGWVPLLARPTVLVAGCHCWFAQQVSLQNIKVCFRDDMRAMRKLLRTIVSRYFDSRWIPTACCLSLLVVAATAALPACPAIIANTALIGFALASLGVLSAAIWNIIRKRWANGITNLAMLPVCAVATIVVLFFLMFVSFLGPSEDHFADDLVIPPDVGASEPIKELEPAPGAPQDTFQARLLASLKTRNDCDETIAADLSPLTQLQQQHPDVLRRYLATSPAWRVFTEHGSIFATRRWMIGSQWQYSLHGYYTRDAIDMWARSGVPDFQSRTTIGLSGEPWNGRNATRLQAGRAVKPSLSTGNGMSESHCIVTAGSLVVELFEQSKTRERRLTKAALKHLDEELQPLAQAPSWATIQEILPSGSIRRGTPSLELRHSFQPGLYNSEVWVNPGESGRVYLKAFEVTKGTPLSAEELKQYSNEWVGWSNDPQQLFFSNAHFTIYEGDWGKPYAAHFEVWFAPDSGKAERRLIEKVFKIEGWQR